MTWRRWSLVVVAVAYIGAVGAGARYLEELRIGGGYGETVDGGMDIDHEGNLWTDGTIYYDVEDLSTGGAAGTVPMSDGDGTLTMTPVDTADIPDTEAELELHLTDVTDVVTNNDAYYQYFIDSAGTTGQVWTSDGSGKGGWSTLSAATDLLVSADNYVPPLGYNYERNDYLYIRGGTGITTSIDDVLSGPRITISRSAASWSAAADSGTNQTIAESGTLTLSGSTTAATKGITTSTDTGKVVFALPTGSSGQVLKHDGTAWAAGTDTTGGTMSSFNFGVSGHMIPVVNGYNVYCYGLRGITVETISGTWGIFNIGLPTATTSGQVLKWDGSAWVAGTDSGTTYTAGTGLNLSGTTFSLQHLGWESLADPNADRVGFWDDSAGAMKWLTIGSNLSITDTTIAATDTNTTYSAGNGLALSSTTFRLTDGSVSGQILKWDGDSWELASDETGSPGSMSFTLAGDSGTSQTIADTNTMSILGGRGLATVASATDTITVNLPSGTSGQVLKNNGSVWVAGADNNTTYTAGTGLNLSGTVFSLQHLGLEYLTDPGADRIPFWDDSEGATKWLQLGTNLSITGTTLNASASAGITNFTLAGDSGTPQTISDGNTLTISGSGGITAVAGATDKVTIGLPSGSSGQVLKHNGTAWAAGTDNTGTTSTHYGMLWLSVSDMFHDRTTGQGPTLNSRTNGTAAYFEHDYYTFDKDTDRDLYASFAVGPDVSGSTVTVSLFTAATNTAGEQKDARWGLSIRALSDDTWPDVLYGFGSTHDTLTYGYYGPNKTRGLEIVSANVTVTGLSSGKWCVMRITRLGSDDGDDLDAGADLMGVRVYYPKS